MRNSDAFSVLLGLGYDKEDAQEAVDALLREGIILPDPEPELTLPEVFAAAAKKWVGGSIGPVYQYASGWSTAGWEAVLNDSYSGLGGMYPIQLEHDSAALRAVFLATVILAKEAGIEI